ncbi:hypothetical protein HNR51_005260 [Methylorubrum thiocyanatum]|jgi:hypothetical protein|uniref:Uncharacterized protein n=1 Tax=Methylorubrum thiocyanatum TaxID=47958 RepID=A0AA40VF64_9HYPH|nr:hypothetical protein [Methylorubrum thiocyanatum]GJE79980.1 hypothetical protein CJNNKLLH_1311 [Methylorubrum thiocyanatum]
MRATESVWHREPGRRRKVRPHIRAAAQKTMLWALLGVLLLGSCVGLCLTTLGHQAALVPYAAQSAR